ncbi:MAG: hypothetical protein ACYSTN_03795 [Planctomycetota bacterium]|jgi:hypothetical protein
MKTKKLLFYLLAGVLVGCVPSLHPLFTDEDAIFEEKLLGIWSEEKDSKETWEFQRYGGQGSKRYKMIYTDNEGKEGSFLTTLGKLDGMLFLDLFPGEVEINTADFYKIHLLGVHTFMKIEQIEPTLQMRAMDPDRIKEMLKNDPNLIKHEVLEKEGSRIVLTASTEELQWFMIDHANDEGLFSEASELKRIKIKDTNEPNTIDPNQA